MGRKLLLEKAHVENIRYYDVYRREGGYRSVEKALKTMSPEAIVEEAVRGMLGKNTLGRAQFTKLKVFVGPTHTHDAQKPEPLTLNV